MPILKRLRRLLRQVKGKLALGGLLTLVTFLASGYAAFYGILPSEKYILDNQATLAMYWHEQNEEVSEVMAQQPVILILKTKYLCGLETEFLEMENMEAVESWLSGQDVSWKKEDISNDQVILTREILNDLSPACKEDAYIGLSEDGVLTLFQGPPIQNQVIETFFRMDTRLLESKLPEAEILTLKNGIQIHDVDNYLRVISTYGKYATE